MSLNHSRYECGSSINDGQNVSTFNYWTDPNRYYNTTNCVATNCPKTKDVQTHFRTLPFNPEEFNLDKAETAQCNLTDESVMQATGGEFNKFINSPYSTVA